jgi:pyruvate ferredoxin oxidoreductase gamma subunit
MFGEGQAMQQIKIQGRGGQGAQTAGQILATAFFREGKYVQAFSSYGGARRGTLVSTFIRVDDQPIRERCDIEEPDAILCFDSSLMDEKMFQGVTAKTQVLVSSAKSANFFSGLADCQIIPVDALMISRKYGLGSIVNSTLLGAFAAILEAPSIENLLAAINEMSPVKAVENAASCLEGYNFIKKAKEVV